MRGVVGRVLVGEEEVARRELDEMEGWCRTINAKLNSETRFAGGSQAIKVEMKRSDDLYEGRLHNILKFFYVEKLPH